MNKLQLLFIYCLCSVVGFAQINISSGGTVNTCSDIFVDSGGAAGNYV